MAKMSLAEAGMPTIFVDGDSVLCSDCGEMFYPNEPKVWSNVGKPDQSVQHVRCYLKKRAKKPVRRASATG